MEPAMATRELPEIRAADMHRPESPQAGQNVEEQTDSEHQILGEMGRICRQCRHDAPGVESVFTNWILRLVGRGPLPARCSHEDGLGGDVGHGGYCGCRDLFHSLSQY